MSRYTRDKNRKIEKTKKNIYRGRIVGMQWTWKNVFKKRRATKNKFKQQQLTKWKKNQTNQASLCYRCRNEQHGRTEDSVRCSTLWHCMGTSICTLLNNAFLFFNFFLSLLFNYVCVNGEYWIHLIETQFNYIILFYLMHWDHASHSPHFMAFVHFCCVLTIWYICCRSIFSFHWFVIFR